METPEEVRKTILAEIASDNTEVRAKYLEHFQSEVEKFAELMAQAFLSWREVDSETQKDEKRAYVSAIVYTAITLHIVSMALFVSGHLVAAGNLFRQVVESIALALLCSSKDLDILERFMNGEYQTNNAIQDALRHSEKLMLRKDGIQSLAKAQSFYHKYSHPTQLTIATEISFLREGLYVGAAFDKGKLEMYRKEVDGRVSLARVFQNFIVGVKANVTKW